MSDRRTSRRSFFQAGAGAALFCTIGNERVDLNAPGAAKRADAAAARVSRPASARLAQELPRPEPAPGGVKREYWIQARSAGRKTSAAAKPKTTARRARPAAKKK
jgi:hypothetical protein